MREDHRLGEGKTEDLWQSGSLVDKVTPDRRPKASAVQSSSRKAPRLASKRAGGIGDDAGGWWVRLPRIPPKDTTETPTLGWTDGMELACGPVAGEARVGSATPLHRGSRHPGFVRTHVVLGACPCSHACCFW